MVDVPERIWAASVTENYGEWQTTTDGLPRPTEYIRADLVAELAAENERLTKLADGLHDEVQFMRNAAKENREAAERLAGARMVTDEMVDAACEAFGLHERKHGLNHRQAGMREALKAAMEAGG